MILFDTNRDGAAEMWVMTAEGSNQRRFVSIGVGNTRFSWQPVFE